jgi:polyphosphate kinase
VEDPHCRRRLTQALETYFQDNVKARRLLSDGSHVRLTSSGSDPLRAQEQLFLEAKAAVKQAEQQRATVFEPHLPSSP